MSCPEGPCLSPSAEDVQIKTNERRFKNHFYAETITLAAGASQEFSAATLLNNCFYEAWIFVNPASDLAIRFNRVLNRDLNIIRTSMSPIKFTEIFADYITIINNSNADITFDIFLATYLSRERLQQAGMEDV